MSDRTYQEWADDLALAIYQHFYGHITYDDDGEPVDNEVDPDEVKKLMRDYHAWKNAKDAK